MEELNNSEQSKTNEDIETMSVEEVGELAWREGKESLIAWKKDFEKFAQENTTEIKKHLQDLSIFYDIPSKETPYLISLHHNPNVRSIKGEPTTNFPEGHRIREMGDVLFWVYKHEDASEEKVADFTKMILHEIQHFSFQSTEEDFRQKLESFEKERNNTQSLKTSLIKSDNFHIEPYANLTIELLTSYIESTIEFYANSAMQTQEAPLVFKIDKQDHTDLLKILIEEDVNKWQNNGPYSKLRSGWNKVLSQREVSDTTFSDAYDTEPPVSNGYDVYSLGNSLDRNLADEYLSSGKAVDADFIERLYEMALEKATNSNIDIG